MEALMKKFLLLAVVAAVFGVSSVQAAGGCAPCLATCILGDPRIGLYMNEGKSIETEDWIVFAGNVLVGLGWVYAGINAYEKAQNAKGFCVGALWGRRAGSEINSTKLRTKEILLCIPILNIYPCIALPLEAFGGKTMSAVIQEEGLSR